MEIKEELKTKIIPAIKRMEEKEREHLHYLIDNDAPVEFIRLSQKYQLHFVERLKEYQEYYDKL